MAGIWDAVNNNLFNPEKPNAPGVLSDVRRASGQFASGLGSTLRDVGLEDTGGALESYGAGVVRRNPSEIQSFQDVLSRPFTTAREAVGEIVPQVGLAVGGQLAGRAIGGFLGAPLGPLGIIGGQQLGGLVGGLAPIVAQTYGGIRSEQREAGIDDRPRALGATIPAAALERFGGAERIAGKIAGQGTQFLAREAGESLWGALSRQALRGGVEETITEIPQTALERYGAYKTLTGPEAFDEYGVAGAKAFLGGGAVRAGLSAVAGTRPAQGEIDLTQPETPIPPAQTPTGLDISATTPAAQPTTTSLVSQETDLTAPADTSTAEVTTPAATTTTSAAAPTDLTATTAEAADTTPSIFSKTDEALNELNIKPTKKSRSIYDYMVAKGIDPTSEEAEPILNALSENKFKFATDTIGAIIRARSPRGAAVSTVQQPAGSVGVGGAVVPGTLGTAGSDASLTGAVGGGAATTGAPLQQVGLLPNAAGQPSTVVDQGPTTRGAPGTTPLVDTSDDALEIARATGNAAEIEAMRQDQEGGRADQLDFGDNEMTAVIDERFADSKNKERDRKILQAYILARKSVPEGYKGDVAQEVADTFNMDVSRVRQIGNPELLANIAEGMGFDRSQVFTHLGIDSAKKAAATELGKLESDLAKLEAKEAPSKADIAKMSELSEKIDQVKGNIESGDMTSALKALGLEGEAGEMFSSLDDSREWQKASTAGSQMAVKLVGIADKIAELKAAAAELKQLGLAKAEAAATERINTLAADYATLTSNVKASKAELRQAQAQAQAEKQTEAEQKAAEEKAAALKAEAEKLSAESAAKRAADRKGLEVGDTVVNPKLGTGVVKGFSGDGDATIVTVDFKSGQTKELSVKMAKLEKTNAVQVKSTAVVPVQSEAQAGQGVGGQVRRAEKPASKGQVTVQGQAKGQVTNKGQALWESLAANTPGLVSYDQLTKLEQDYLTDLAVRTNGKPSVAKEMGLQQLLAKEPITIEGETRIIDDQVTQQVAALPAPQVDRLEKHYGAKRDTAEFLEKVQADITKYVTQGAEAVAGAIRSIIKSMAEGVLAMGIVFNPNITKDAFNINVAKTFEQTSQVTKAVPEEAKAQMSPLAQQTYEAMAPVAMKTGKWFMVADKPNGMLHIFKEDGSHALSDPTLYGKDTGDVLAAVSSLEGGAKTTPAGKFTLKARASTYAGGQELILVESKDYTGYIAIHAADTSTPSENRLGRLDTPTAADNRVSYGCINTKHDTFVNDIAPNIANLDGGMVFVLPDAQEQTAQMFAAETRTETRTEGGQGAKGQAAATLVGKEETIDTAVNRILRLTRGDTVEVKAGTLKFDGQITDEASLRRFPGVDSALSHYENNDLRHVIDDVELWMVAPDTVDFDAAVMMVDGKQTLAVRSGMLVNTDFANWAIHHELGHIADDAFRKGGIYSQHQDLNLTIQKGVVRPMGSVVREIMQYMAENPTSSFTRTMGYPLDHTRKDTKNMTADETRMEVFAQLWAFYNTREGNAYLADNLPLTYDFMEINDEAAKQNKGDAGLEEGAADQAAGPQAQADRGTQRITPAILRIGRPSQSVVQRTIDKLPKPLQKSAREQWTNISTLAKRGLYASAITEDVIGLATKYMPSAAKYLKAQYDRQGTRLEFERRIEDILGAFEKLPENLKGVGKGSVNEYIQDSTVQKKWGYYPGEQQIGTTLFETDPDLEERFKAFPPAAQKVIKDVFRHGYEALRLKQKAAESAVNREFEAREKAAGNDLDMLQSLAKEKAQMLRRMTRLRNVEVSEPYAYLGRYGDYVVVAKSKEFIAYEEAAKGTEARVGADSITGDAQQAKNWLQDNVSNPLHYVVQFAETQGEADSIAADLQATGQYDIQPEDAGIKEASASYAGGSDVHMAVARLRNLANRQSESTDTKLDKAISDLYLMTVAEASARRSELERKNVSGADKNMMRNLATSGRADAHFLANMEHGDAINDALETMRNQARNNRKEAMPLYNELYTRYADSMEYSQPSVLAQNMLRMSTLWHLSTSPAYYLQQALQTSVLSLPYMAGRLGYARSASAIKRAYGDMSDLVSGLGVSDRIDFDKAPADVRFMLKELVRMGKIDIGVDADATARIDDKGPLGKAMFKLQNVNARIEAINRATAAIAAYRGYVDLYKNAPGADGVKFAADVVSNSHGNYDGFNTPRVMQSGGAKVLLQFKRFQIIQLSMLAKLIHTSFKGASAEERAIARASLKYITAHMAVLGGALGVPFVSQAASILSSVFGDEDEPDDYEYKLRRMIGDGAVADLLLRGVPAALGLESIGKRLAMENVASPFGPFVEFNLTSRADAAQMIVGMMGPSVGLGLKFVDALGMMSKGEYYKGLELALPNGIANLMKGYRFGTEGITMRNGDLVLKPEDISLIDTAFQAVGLPTTTITDRQYTQKVVAEFDKFYSQRAGEIKSSYLKASRQSDAAAMADARTSWQELQDSRAKNGYKRQPLSELLRVPAEARKRERGVVGGVETTKSNRRFVEQVSSVS